MMEGREFDKLYKQWSWRKARNLTEIIKSKQQKDQISQICIKRFKVESWSKFEGHLESHYMVQRKQVARLKQKSN